MSNALPTSSPGPDQSDVDAVRDMLDQMTDFRDNDQRARYLLTSDWMRDRGAAAARRLNQRPGRGTITDEHVTRCERRSQ